ncbi:Glycoside Hydrolase Family 16 protein [Gigaspora rosea]|uniref:Glycoside Hydrolase Family 16 protein n=1 Tax=Gigaspora rosea TaxID=44941 RepID=A0A397UQ61_9GLOM|nr:Glycoside Hydrolase Family 16 protein [Gigaspora rosea]
MIPQSSFSNYSNFESYWNYLYPWGPSHKGTALMLGNSSYHEHIYLNNSVLTLKATRNNHKLGGKKFNYLSGTIYAKKHIEVNSQYPNYSICGDFKVPTIKGTWPAFWITCTTSWPPEVDILEFKGSTFNNFNIFQIHKNVPTSIDRTNISSPNDWNTFCFYMDRINNNDVSLSLSLNNMSIITHNGTGFVLKQFWLIIDLQMEGSSGNPGPSSDTFYYLRNVKIISNY